VNVAFGPVAVGVLAPGANHSYSVAPVAAAVRVNDCPANPVDGPMMVTGCAAGSSATLVRKVELAVFQLVAR
jgi:hypothetical protein